MSDSIGQPRPMTDPAAAPTHACLISNNLLPNLIPVLMDRPARAHLVVSAKMGMATACWMRVASR